MGGRGSGGGGRKTDKEKRLSGTFQSCRAEDKRETTGKRSRVGGQGPDKDPRAPRNLSREARTLWRKVTTIYDFRGDVNSQILLHEALKAYDKKLEVERLIEQEGSALENPKTGQKYENPRLNTWRKYDQSFHRYWKHLGLEWPG